MKAKLNIYVDKRKEMDFYPVYFVVYRKTQTYIKTPITCKTEIVGREFRKDEPNRNIKNKTLNVLYNKVEELILDADESMTNKALKQLINNVVFGNGQLRDKTLLDYMDEFISTMSNSGTVSIYNLTRAKIEKFDGNAMLNDVDRVWLSKFERFMKDAGMSVNYINMHMKNLRATFNYCIDCEYTTKYPFRKFKLHTEPTAHRCLTVGQLVTLRDYPVEEFQEIYRDMFMLMFYLIGINAGDLLLCKKLINGHLIYNRKKTGRHYEVKVEPEAQAIIDKYKGKGHLLNVCDTYKDYKEFVRHMNRGLKSIGKTFKEGCKTTGESLYPDLSSNWARHTWATIASEIGIDKDTIGKALGHSWALDSVTDIYIKMDKRKIDEANRKVIDYVNGKKR